ncbi:enhancer of mRNA-decapping protein 4 isoform X2 [Anthonomus grandis grandis]|uniref:enhancer of mRNA-decapping protein 4 isoform X2 n=1 Tax=Anthonomus grandis grandis TaxID=2921223 RepID=UPI0021655044|nr:enhancer of mRNA-decapping protein 4 isoform X2 [Anthonomus grandis grandis]
MNTSTPVPQTQCLVQNIKFSGPESEYVTELKGQVVNLQCNDGNHNHGSSKVKLTDRIDYNWEFKYYHGRLVAAHISGNIIAYAMKGKDGGMIRVVQEKNHRRALIKNLKEDIKDLSFAYSPKEVILGCVDCEGNIFVYSIEDGADCLKYTILLHIAYTEPIRPKTNFRLAWCPYVPSTEEDAQLSDESEKMFVVLNGTKAKIYSVAILNTEYVNKGPLNLNNSCEGYSEIIHSSDLVDASFSSDGCAIALACQDGYVKFFQLFMFEPELQKCLHKWIPHEGKALSSVIFVDNILEYTINCWKFALTGAENNTELKLWSCEAWTCLQTINFLPSPKSIVPDLFLNVAADYSGKYVVVSDINNRAIYVMELQKNEEKQVAYAGTMAHFLLPAPFLSFHILEAGVKSIPYSIYAAEDPFEEDNDEDYEDESEACVSVRYLKMLVIQPKKFQECDIMFQMDALMYKDVVVTENVVEELIDLKNEDNEKDNVVEKIPELDDLQNSVTLLIQQQQHSNSKMTLMTPDDFSPGKTSKANSVRNSITQDNSLGNSCDKLNDAIEQKENYASAGSSPSREVQEILSLTNSSSGGFPTQEYYNNLANLQVEEKDPPPKDSEIVYQDTVTWPKIPIMKESDVIKQMQVENSNEINKQDLETVYLRINSLETLVKEQSGVMQLLLRDMKAVLQNLEMATNRSNDKTDTEELSREWEAAMSKQHLQIAKMFENLVQLQKSNDKDLQEKLLSTVGQISSKTISDKIQFEMKHSVLNNIHQMMDTLRLQLESQLNHRFNNIECMFRDNLTKMLNSKTLIEAISVSIVNAVSPALDRSYREQILQVLVPSCEKVCTKMFEQIKDTFTKGTKEYTASVESYMERQRRLQDRGKDLVGQMQNVAEHLKTNSDTLSEILTTEINKHFNKAFKTIQEQVSQNIKDLVSLELKRSLNSQGDVVEQAVMNALNRSRAVTPAPSHADNHMQTLAHIQHTLSKHAYDEAFQIALSAENLGVVIFVCEKVDVNRVFGEQCLLSQSVLLALIQQLSMELHKNTETKLCFIRAAFLALSPDVSQTKQFIPKVLRDLSKQLTTFMQNNPPLKQMTEARLLKMAVENMLALFVIE